MSIPGSLTPLFNSGAGGAAGYQIERSLRFNSADSAYLSRTPAVAGNRKTWTWAGWVKRSKLGVEQTIFGCMANDVSFYTNLTIEVNDKIYIYESLTANGRALATTQLFRDPSAWFHVLLHYNTTDATNSNKAKLYINGTEVTQFDEDNRSYLTSDASVNRAAEHTIGKRTYSPAPNYFSGYLADVHFIDGQALTPSSFTEVSATTGQLIPLAYSGTFGTNGFWLKFSDNSNNTAATLGKDSFLLGNDWTPNNLSVTAGAGNDSLVDSPTSFGTDTYVGGEVRGNYATLNPLNAQLGTGSVLNGNLDFAGPSGSANYNFIGGTFGIDTSTSTGWYFEITQTTYGGGASISLLDQSFQASALWNQVPIGYQSSTNSNAGVSYRNDGYMWNYGTETSGLTTWQTSGDVISIAIKNNKIWFAKNGTWISGSPSAGTSPSITLASTKYVTPAAVGINSNLFSFNFGQRAFAYTAPSGFKALCDTNIAEGTITTSGTFTGNASADGPFVYLNGVPTAMTINSNSVTFGTHADKLSNGFKVRNSTSTYNVAGSNTFSVSTTGAKFKFSRAQPNP